VQFSFQWRVAEIKGIQVLMIRFFGILAGVVVLCSTICAVPDGAPTSGIVGDGKQEPHHW
jgi:hypothetical protein